VCEAAVPHAHEFEHRVDEKAYQAEDHDLEVRGEDTDMITDLITALTCAPTADSALLALAGLVWGIVEGL
jgi:hypothetical protein